MSVRITSNGHDNKKRIEWKILHFFHFFHNLDYVIDSPSFSIFNTRFHLRLEIEYKPIGYVCMYMCHLSKFEYKAEYVMGIKNVDGSEVKTEKLEFLISKPGGTPSLELIPLMELSKSKDLMVPDDCLTVFCNICRIEMPIYSFPKISSLNSSLNSLLISLLKNKVIIEINAEDILSSNTALHEVKDVEELNAEHFLSSIASLNEDKDVEELNAEDFLSSIASLNEGKDVKELNAEDFLSSIASLNDVKDIEEINEDILSSNTALHEVKVIEEQNADDSLSSNTELHEAEDIEELNAEDFLSSNTSLHEVKGIGDSQDSYVNDAISILMENFKDLYLKKRYTDITIKVQNKEFHAHKLILNARLRYFASMFHHDSFEGRTGIVEITDCDPDSFDDFLLFQYTADLNIVSSKNVFELYKTSDKYGCKELMKECVRCMIQHLSSDTFCDYFYLATMHNEFKLLTASINYFIKNAKRIILTTKWLILLEEHPTLCNELLIKFTNVL